VDSRNRTIKNHGQKFALAADQDPRAQGPVTLMCHCESDERCHRSVLKGDLSAQVSERRW
jgi:uncharacterized protein YeaO (DUF488 family)